MPLTPRTDSDDVLDQILEDERAASLQSLRKHMQEIVEPPDEEREYTPTTG